MSTNARSSGRFRRAAAAAWAAVARPDRTAWWVLGGLAFLFVTVFRSRHDYGSYSIHWRQVLAGADPYALAGNAYGPLHNALALLFAVHPKLPRFLFVACTFASTFVLAQRLREGVPEKDRGGWVRHLVLSPLFWVFVVFLGSNDGLQAPLILAGCIAFLAGRDATAGVALGLGTLLKFMPIFIVPFFVVTRRRINWTMGLAYGITVALGFGIGWWLWGDAVLGPLVFNSTRESRLLSIFAFLGGPVSPLRLAGIANVDFLSTPLLAGALVVLFVLHVRDGFEPITSATAGLATVLLLFKVGNHQFHLNLIFLVALLLAIKWESLQALHARAVKAAWLYLGWIAFCTALYAVTEGYYRRFAFIRDVIGLPTFLIVAPLAWHLFVFARAEARARASVALPAGGGPVRVV